MEGISHPFGDHEGRHTHKFIFAVLVLVVSILGLWDSTAIAQEYPTKLIKLIVPAPPGGAIDMIGRIMAQKLSEGLGQQVIVDNRGGAGGTIGTEAAAKSPADGYTILLGAPGGLATHVTLYKNLPYDPLKDLTPVIQVASLPLVLVVHSEIPAKTVKELIALLKAKPDGYSFASAGNGSPMHLTAELFKTMAEVKMMHVPYRGSAQAMNDLVGGQVLIAFESITATQASVKGGRIRALATTGNTRSSALPNVPTVSEAGVPGFESLVWYGVMAPGGTSKPIVDKLNAVMGKALNTTEVKSRFREIGAEVAYGSPEQFGAFIRAEIFKWGKVVKDSGARVD